MDKLHVAFFALITLLTVGVGVISATHQGYQVEIDRILKTHGPWDQVTVGPDITLLVDQEGGTWWIANRGTEAPVVEFKMEARE